MRYEDTQGRGNEEEKDDEVDDGDDDKERCDKGTGLILSHIFSNVV